MAYIFTNHSCFVTNGYSLSFFFNDTATTEIYTLSLHDALPISNSATAAPAANRYLTDIWQIFAAATAAPATPNSSRSEEHTSELQSQFRISYAVFCLKKKKYKNK